MHKIEIFQATEYQVELSNAMNTWFAKHPQAKIVSVEVLLTGTQDVMRPKISFAGFIHYEE